MLFSPTRGIVNKENGCLLLQKNIVVREGIKTEADVLKKKKKN
jgi:hypothetical protein